MKLARQIGMTLAITMSTNVVLAQGDMSSVEIKTTHVAGNIYMLEGWGGNIGVSVGEDGLLMIDDQMAPLADKIKAALKELKDDKLAFLLNTHFHFDHVGGNEIFGQETTIIAHDNVRKRVMTEQNTRGQVTPPRPGDAWPVITFEKSLSIHFNGEEIKAVHYSTSHTDGDAVIFFSGSNVVHMGDLFFNKRLPFVDLDGGGNAIRLSENVGEIVSELPDDAMIIPGHGPLATVDDLTTYHRMLTETIAHVRQAKEAGKSLEECQSAGLPEEWLSWGWNFIPVEFWIETVYKSLDS